MPSLSEALPSFSTVILTGGSSGIGKSFIRLIGNVTDGPVICNLSRRSPERKLFPDAEKRLNHFSCDLSQVTAVAATAEAVTQYVARAVPTGRVLLINNSGLGGFGAFSENELERDLAMIDVNVRAVVQLTALLLPLLRARGGAIMNVASTVAFQPTPFAATYGATKAFVLHWTIALDHELRGSGVRALAVCPGTTRTEFFQAAGLAPGVVPHNGSMSADEVVEAAFRALAGGRSQVVPGWLNKAYTFAASKLPKSVAAGLAARVLRRRRSEARA